MYLKVTRDQINIYKYCKMFITFFSLSTNVINRLEEPAATHPNPACPLHCFIPITTYPIYLLLCAEELFVLQYFLFPLGDSRANCKHGICSSCRAQVSKSSPRGPVTCNF
ncbi:hypothetical protein ILYODFUR_017915 [Ilyodon furcidens]|uniref:Uncharacterized protein n=1 Tax=Ilyodon furcidens TaxID=33524 RepID=A0ABV0UHI2_9TELE